MSKAAAVDGMAITAISKSKAIAGYVQQKGFKMPKSPTTISKCINSFYKEKCTELRENFEKLKIAKRKFATAVDGLHYFTLCKCNSSCAWNRLKYN